jgi:hypothetical protein
VSAPLRVERMAESGTASRLPRWGFLLGAWLATLFVAALIAQLLMLEGDWGIGLPWEHRILEAFDDPLPWWLDTIMLIVPWFGTNITLLPATLGASAWMYWRAHRPDLARHLLVMHAGVFALTMIGKVIFDRPRPELWPQRGQFAHASYPSGHLGAAAPPARVAMALRASRGDSADQHVLAPLSRRALAERCAGGDSDGDRVARRHAPCLPSPRG